jgi:hypothetical protein
MDFQVHDQSFKQLVTSQFVRLAHKVRVTVHVSGVLGLNLKSGAIVGSSMLFRCHRGPLHMVTGV